MSIRRSTSFRERTATDFNDITTTVAASDIAETVKAEPLTPPLFTQERHVSANPFGVSDFHQAAASGSQQQQASSSMANPRQKSDLGRSWEQEQGNESCQVLKGHC